MFDKKFGLKRKNVILYAKTGHEATFGGF